MMPGTGKAEIQDSRRLKKRESDRKAQRLARERTRKRIADLEGTVKSLQRSESGAQLSSILEQLSRVTEERDEILQTLKLMWDIMHRHIEPVAPGYDLQKAFGDTGTVDKGRGLKLDNSMDPVHFPGLTDTPAYPVVPRNYIQDDYHKVETWFCENQANGAQVNNFPAPVDFNRNDIPEFNYTHHLRETNTQLLQPEGFNNGFV
ncbi:hypothetical protein ACHAPJ_013384 [Fusarium lateritium]